MPRVRHIVLVLIVLAIGASYTDAGRRFSDGVLKLGVRLGLAAPPRPVVAEKPPPPRKAESPPRLVPEGIDQLIAMMARWQRLEAAKERGGESWAIRGVDTDDRTATIEPLGDGKVDQAAPARYCWICAVDDGSSRRVGC